METILVADLPGLEFDVDGPSVLRLRCPDCGHEFVPSTLPRASPRATWEAAMRSPHMTLGCRATPHSVTTL